jgi:hypothetical protein
MVRKLSLPLSDASRRPTVDAVRKRLGGRASTETRAGELVTLGADGEGPAGVILYARGDEICVWTDAGVVRRVPSSRVSPVRGGSPKALESVARDARVFAALLEGDRVRYEEDKGTGEGTLVEKCRFGALVQRPDGTILGIGFRRLWPVTNASGSEGN